MASRQTLTSSRRSPRGRATPSLRRSTAGLAAAAAAAVSRPRATQALPRRVNVPECPIVPSAPSPRGPLTDGPPAPAAGGHHSKVNSPRYKLAPMARTKPESRRGEPADPATIVIFGASGDLAKRKLFPALLNLHR